MKIVIRIPPVTKKNSQRILKNRKTGKVFIAPSKQYEQYAHDAAFFIPKAGIDYPVNVKCLFYMPTKRQVDLTNLLEAACDALVSCGCIKDDNSKIVVSHDGSRVLYDKDNPRTEISIERMDS